MSVFLIFQPLHTDSSAENHMKVVAQAIAETILDRYILKCSADTGEFQIGRTYLEISERSKRLIENLGLNRIAYAHDGYTQL